MRQSRWMRLVVGILLLSGLVPGAGAFREEKVPALSPDDAAIAREKAVWKAAQEQDKGTLDALVDDDARMIFTSGIMTKKQYLDSSSERKIAGYELSDFQVLTPADDTVIVIYNARISGVFHGKPASYSVREASVWVQREKGWVAVLNQETPM
jgi:hypothetical protein